MFDYKFKRLNLLSLKEIEELKPLTLSNYSHLYSLLSFSLSNWILSGYDTKVSLDSFVLIGKNSKTKEIIGWAGAHRTDDNTFIVSVFVKEEYRNKRIGKELFESIKSKIEELKKEKIIWKVFPRDKIGRKLYKKEKNE